MRADNEKIKMRVNNEKKKKLLVAMKLRRETKEAVLYWSHMTRRLRKECEKVMDQIKRKADNPDHMIDNKIELYSTLVDQLGVAAMKEIEARHHLTILINLIKNTQAGL